MKYCKQLMLVLAVICFLPGIVISEEVANYADCDICHGAIHFDVEETKKILGEGIIDSTSKLPFPRFRVVRIDLDGVLKQDISNSDNDGYELQVWGSKVVFIQDLRDKSTIQIVTSREALPEYSFDSEKYQPHIYLDGGKNHAIDLEDSIEDAWVKFKFTNIYSFVGKTDNKEEWLKHLREKIYKYMDVLSKAR